MAQEEDASAPQASHRYRSPAAAVARRHDSSMPRFCWARDTAQPAISKCSCQCVTMLRFPISPPWSRDQQACFAPSSTFAGGKRDGSNNVSHEKSKACVVRSRTASILGLRGCATTGTLLSTSISPEGGRRLSRLVGLVYAGIHAASTRTLASPRARGKKKYFCGEAFRLQLPSDEKKIGDRGCFVFVLSRTGSTASTPAALTLTSIPS